MNINFGCGKKLLKNYKNFDKEINLEKRLPFKNNIADKIMLDNVLEHIYKQRELMLETYRILKKNGYIEIYVPFWSSRIEHTRHFYPKGYFNDLCGLGSENSNENVDLFFKDKEYYCRKKLMVYFPFINKNLYVKLIKL